MKRLAVLLLLGWLLVPLQPALADDYPAPDGYVVDSAGVISPAVEKCLEAELRDDDRWTSNLLLVAPAERRLEIRTAPTSRIDDATAQAALDQLAPYLRAGDLIGGVKAALRLLAEAAGPVPPGSVPLPELPDVLTG